MAVTIGNVSVRPWNDPSDGVGDVFHFYATYQWNVGGLSSEQDVWISVNTNMNSDEFIAFGDGAYRNPVSASGFSGVLLDSSLQEVYLDRKTPLTSNVYTYADHIIYGIVKHQYGGSRDFGGED